MNLDAPRVFPTVLKSCAALVLAIGLLLFQEPAASGADSTGQVSGASSFLNNLEGLVHRTSPPAEATNPPSRWQGWLTNLTGAVGARTNANSLSERLGAYLSAQNSTNALSSNLVQRLHAWLDSQQRAATNPASTGELRHAWANLTNYLAGLNAHGTNPGTTSDSGTNLLQRLRNWVALEQQNHGGATNSQIGEAVNALNGYLSTNQAVRPTATVATNSTPGASLFQGLGNLLNRR